MPPPWSEIRGIWLRARQVRAEFDSGKTPEKEILAYGEELVGNLTHSDTYIQGASAEAIGELRSDEFIEPLLANLKGRGWKCASSESPAAYERSTKAPAVGLAKIGTARSRLILLDSLPKNDKAFFALAYLLCSESLRLLRDELGKYSTHSRRCDAIHALGIRRDVDSRSLIKTLSQSENDKDYVLRAYAKAALNCIDGNMAIGKCIEWRHYLKSPGWHYSDEEKIFPPPSAWRIPRRD